jgi:hypothetical protein
MKYNSEYSKAEPSSEKETDFQGKPETTELTPKFEIIPLNMEMDEKIDQMTSLILEDQSQTRTIMKQAP